MKALYNAVTLAEVLSNFKYAFVIQVWAGETTPKAKAQFSIINIIQTMWKWQHSEKRWKDGRMNKQI